MSALALIQEGVAGVLVVAGAVFVLIGAFGVVRLPDFWARLHAASIGDSAGMLLLFAGMAVHSGLTLVTVKLILIGIFLFLTGPTSTHATANAAFVSGLRPREAEGLTADEPLEVATPEKEPAP
ncbi:MAG TPA: hypothetical protein ENJ52_08880 [Aliiroseovarius sp.]|nr:hypothetical protein [Aliiroseovarius sp.]